MAGKAPIDAVNVIHDALENLDRDDQLKALKAAVLLLGITAESVGLVVEKPATSKNNSSGRSTAAAVNNGHDGVTSEVGSAAEFFKAKDPQGLIEVLAVAARFRELNEKVESHTKEDFDSVFRAARRNVPSNFPRDLKNAKKQQYFNSGSDIVLSHYGQNYVDALPDRESARAINRPKKLGGSKKKKTKVNG